MQRVATSAGLPRWIYIPAAMGALFVVVPLIAVAAKVDWPRFWSLITSESSTTALKLSLETSLASTTLCVLLGVPMALLPTVKPSAGIFGETAKGGWLTRAVTSSASNVRPFLCSMRWTAAGG